MNYKCNMTTLITVDSNNDIIIVNVINFCSVVLLAFPVVCDINFIRKSLLLVSDIPIVKPGTSLYRSAKIFIPGSPQIDPRKLLRARNDGKVEWNTTRCIPQNMQR